LGVAMSPIFRTTGAAGAEPGYDRPAANRHQSRSAVIAPQGMVATSQPLAVQAGIDILKAGGNAVDAAIAVNAVLGVVEPMSCGIGGDLFAIVWDAKTQKLYGLNASGRSPYQLNREVFRQKGLQRVPVYGPLAWSVPGCVDGWAQLRSRFGTMNFQQILAPAIQYAAEGFPVSEIIAGGWAGSEEELSQWPDSAKTYLPGGRAPAVGEVFKNPYLARTYEMIADGGRDAFYNGPVAEQIVAASEKVGGYFSSRDFAEHTSTWVEPVSTNYRGYDVWELPPNGQGIAALQMLNLLEAYDLKSLGHNSAEHLHRFVEAKKLAFADRAKFYADPALADLPVTELISKQYADARRRLIDPDRAALEVPAGDPLLVEGDTVYLTVVDKDRNCVSLIQSIFHGFGSQVVPGDLGFALQNRGALFNLDPDHLNTLEPHKRPFHTIIPAFVTKDGKPFLSFGVMGGDMQPQGHVQVLVNLIDFGMDVQQAGDAARVRHYGSQSPTGDVMTDGGEVMVESGVSDAAIEGLRRRGHRVRRGGVGGFGGYQAIRIDPESGMLHAGSDPRKDGCAMGY
ncbi:MAG: gamma-glutamyltransferase, partial [Pirellulales bacterium]